MRKSFAMFLYQLMSTNSKIWLVTADLGYKLWDDIKRDYPDRFVNTGASEQAAMGICVGLALEGKIPVFYSISTFALFRPFETIRNYMHNEQVPVKIVAGGRDKDYAHDGYSHWPLEQLQILNLLNIDVYYPQEKDNLDKVFDKFIKSKKPSFLSLKK